MSQIQLLVERVNDLLQDFKLNEHDLINPSREKLRDFLLASFLELNVLTESVKGIFGQDSSNPMVPAINIHFTMCKLYAIDESDVGLFDLLNPSSNSMIFIVTRVVDFLECADKHFTCLYSLSERYTSAKQQLSCLNDEIDKAVQAYNVAKLQAQHIQQSTAPDRKKYETAAEKYGEVDKELQHEANLLQQAQTKVQVVDSKRIEMVKSINRLKEKIDQIDSKANDCFYESIEDDVSTLKAKVEAIKDKKEHLNGLIRVKKETEKRLKEFLKAYNSIADQLDEFKLINNTIAMQKEKKGQQYCSVGLKDEVIEAEAALAKIDKELAVLNEICESKQQKRIQVDSEHAGEMAEEDSKAQKLTLQSRTLGSELKKLTSSENECLNKIDKINKDFAECALEFRKDIASSHVIQENMFAIANSELIQLKDHITEYYRKMI